MRTELIKPLRDDGIPFRFIRVESELNDAYFSNTNEGSTCSISEERFEEIGREVVRLQGIRRRELQKLFWVPATLATGVGGVLTALWSIDVLDDIRLLRMGYTIDVLFAGCVIAARDSYQKVFKHGIGTRLQTMRKHVEQNPSLLNKQQLQEAEMGGATYDDYIGTNTKQ